MGLCVQSFDPDSESFNTEYSIVYFVADRSAITSIDAAEE
jgi:hypothetical protein